MKSNLVKRGFLALLVTQFFGAANDNVLKQVLIFMVGTGVWAGQAHWQSTTLWKYAGLEVSVGSTSTVRGRHRHSHGSPCFTLPYHKC